MKFGMRKPSIRKSISARTTGRFKRQLKHAVIPGYGRKGVGLLKDPERSVRNAVYRRTTFSLRDLFR